MEAVQIFAERGAEIGIGRRMIEALFERLLSVEKRLKENHGRRDELNRILSDLQR